MQRNRAYSSRVKKSKTKATRQRSKTTDATSKKKKSSKRKAAQKSTVLAIFRSFKSIECASNHNECKALLRVVHILQLYTKYITQYSRLYHGQSTYQQSTVSSPYDVVTEPTLKPSNSFSNSTKKKRKSSKKYKLNGATTKSQRRAVTPTTAKLKASRSEKRTVTAFSSYFANLGAYDIIHLLNDFNHLSEEHPVCALVDHTKHHCICNVHRCTSLNRMYRKRQAQYLGVDEPNEVITQQIMDRIHIYMLHTFDIGMKLNPKDFENKDYKEDKEDVQYLDETLCKMNEWIASKRVVLEKLTGNKYITKFTSTMDETAHNDWTAGHYSPRFYYWSVYSNWEASDKNNPGYNYLDWYCAAKHSSLKHEMVNNLSNPQWNDLIHLCSAYEQCAAIKNIKADFEDLHGYGIKRYTAIQPQHLLSLLIYCNFEKIRNRFCQTFVRIPSQETDEHLMERHSQFAHLARLLRESVEVFGQRTLFSKVNRFYHSMDKAFRFKQIYGYFNGPTSTSLHYETVINLNEKCGVILQFADKNDTHINGGLRFFDTSLLSDFVYESEMLFISSPSPLHIETVIQCNLGHNYGFFVHSLDVLYQMMKGQRYENRMNDEKDELYKKCAYKLMEHQLWKSEPHATYNQYADLPKYIDDLLDYFFLSTTQIHLNCEHLSDKCEALFIEDKCIELGLLCKLFPNIMRIAVHSAKGRLAFDDDGFAKILKLLSCLSKSHCHLQEIIFKEALPRSVCQLISQYEQMFIESQWFITQQGSALLFSQSFDMV